MTAQKHESPLPDEFPKANSREAWDKIYSRGQQLVEFPWSNVVSYVNRLGFRNLQSISIIELGCGSGPNIQVFQQYWPGDLLQYTGIEQSSVASDSARRRLGGRRSRVLTTDILFGLSAQVPNSIDLVIDRASLTHCEYEYARATIAVISRLLKPGGIFVGLDFFGTEHSDFAEDGYIAGGQFEDVGYVKFYDRQELLNLVPSELSTVSLSEKLETIQEFGQRDIRRVHTFDLVLRKPPHS